jgi:hypothetical protein
MVGDNPRVRRGTLRIYLGAAPGVGKTVAMLGEGRRRAERGQDVVVGFVETHGRAYTAKALEGLEMVPRRALTHRGAEFTELDTDAILARNPQNLLCLSSSRLVELGGGVKAAVDLAGEVALEASADLSEGASFGASAFDVGAGAGVHAHAGDDGHVQRAVQAPVAAAVDAVADRVAGGGRDRVHAGEAGEGGL